MISRKIEDWLQTIGLFGVVGSLIFVGLQLKQDREIALSEIWQQRTATVVEKVSSLASNEMALSAFEKAANGRLDEITPIEDQAGLFEVWGAMFLWENSHYQYTLGFLPDEHWKRVRVDIKSQLQKPFWGPKMLELTTVVRPSFGAVVEEINRELIAEED